MTENLPFVFQNICKLYFHEKAICGLVRGKDAQMIGGGGGLNFKCEVKMSKSALFYLGMVLGTWLLKLNDFATQFTRHWSAVLFILSMYDVDKHLSYYI